VGNPKKQIPRTKTALGMTVSGWRAEGLAHPAHSATENTVP
jgi:hypothetical protein